MTWGVPAELQWACNAPQRDSSAGEEAGTCITCLGHWGQGGVGAEEEEFQTPESDLPFDVASRSLINACGPANSCSNTGSRRVTPLMTTSRASASFAQPLPRPAPYTLGPQGANFNSSCFYIASPTILMSVHSKCPNLLLYSTDQVPELVLSISS